jgi:hypothetical protein
MTLNVNPNPAAVGPGQIIVSLTDATGQPVEGGTITIEGTMNHDGMQPRMVKAKAGTVGQYEAPFLWSMAGDWALTVTAALPNGGEVKQQFDLTVGGEMAMDEHEHDEAPARIPNQDAVVKLVLPQDGAMIEAGQEFKVEIETENFEMGVDGNHWHVYVDGHSPRMIMGTMMETVFSDLPPGHHEISAYLSVGDHEELAEGDSVMITVTGDDTQDSAMSMGDNTGEHTHEHDME